MSLFQTYEEEFKDASKELTDDVAALRATLTTSAPGYRAPPATGPTSRASRSKKIQQLLTKIQKELLHGMDVELNDVPTQQREAARERLATYKKTIFAQEKDFAKLKQDAATADRTDLIGNGANVDTVGLAANQALEGLDDETKKQRMQMARNSAQLGQGTNTLRKAEHLLDQTEDLSNQVVHNLAQQTEQIQNIHNKTRLVDDELSQVRRILTEMHKEMVKNKAVLLIIICVLLLLIFLVLYIKFGGSSSTSDTTVVVVTVPPAANPPPSPVTPSPYSSGSGSY